ILSMQFRDSSIDNLPILYGGSVTPANAKELISVQGVNGFLIGGASLNINSFISIVRIVEKN
ncbi:MAG TPA: triose-phosphate isomerase, partial [Candidatus Marinimicrobia bacterium]|nr:triose-phosphate isomerase [Candidatus Neomarinimicrobiota bacterium]